MHCEFDARTFNAFLFSISRLKAAHIRESRFEFSHSLDPKRTYGVEDESTRAVALTCFHFRAIAGDLLFVYAFESGRYSPDVRSGSA
jgi:hypothetical protein